MSMYSPKSFIETNKLISQSSELILYSADTHFRIFLKDQIEVCIRLENKISTIFHQPVATPIGIGRLCWLIVLLIALISSCFILTTVPIPKRAVKGQRAGMSNGSKSVNDGWSGVVEKNRVKKRTCRLSHAQHSVSQTISYCFSYSVFQTSAPQWPQRQLCGSHISLCDMLMKGHMPAEFSCDNTNVHASSPRI